MEEQYKNGHKKTMILNTFRKEDYEKINFQSRVQKQRIRQKLQFQEMYKR